MMHTTKLGSGGRGHGQYPECRVGWVQSREVCGVQSREVYVAGVARYAGYRVARYAGRESRGMRRWQSR